MRQYTQAELERLIQCDKVIAEPPKKDLKLDRGHWRNDMQVKSKDGKARFSVFVRINERLPENFSVGLIYHPADDPTSIGLLRCNGQHGEHNNHVIDNATMAGFHIHKATEEAITAEFETWDYAEPTKEYASYQQALAHFFRITNIRDAEKHFPEVAQPSLFTTEEREQ